MTSRKIKNVIYNYNDSQKKVRDATSNDPWGPSSTTMSEIADLTYNMVAFPDIMDMIWKRINDKGKNWRHVYKSLVLLDYIIKTGSERVAQQCKERIVDINTLKDFSFYDGNNQDVGRNVREKSKQIVALLQDDERLKTERVQAMKAKERLAQASQGIGSHTKPSETKPPGTPDTPVEPDGVDTPPPARNLTSEIEQARPQTSNEEELQLQLALAMSKEEAEQDRQQQKNEKIRLEMAIHESMDENSGMLDTAPSQPQPPINDPWAATVSHAAPASQPVPRIDPWAALAAPPPVIMQVPAADPWAPAPAPVQPVSDPWVITSSAPAAIPKIDPWAAISSGQPQDPDADFDLLRSGTTAPIATSTSNDFFGGPPLPVSNSWPTNSGAFDLTDMQNSLLQQQQQPATKKPEDFLGANSSLVNLDALVGPPKPSQLMPQAPNPFLSGGVSGGGVSGGGVSGGGVSGGGMAAPQNNPFQQQRQPAPTINQMRAEPMMGMSQQGVVYGAGGAGFSATPGMGASSLPPPLIPLSGASSQSQMQPQQASNPFLL